MQYFCIDATLFWDVEVLPVYYKPRTAVLKQQYGHALLQDVATAVFSTFETDFFVFLPTNT